MKKMFIIFVFVAVVINQSVAQPVTTSSNTGKITFRNESDSISLDVEEIVSFIENGTIILVSCLDIDAIKADEPSRIKIGFWIDDQSFSEIQLVFNEISLDIIEVFIFSIQKTNWLSSAEQSLKVLSERFRRLLEGNESFLIEH